MTVSLNNIAYWLRDPLDPEHVTVLERMAKGRHPWLADRFTEAYLIARDCIEADFDRQTYTVTAKGQDALEFYAEDTRG